MNKTNTYFVLMPVLDLPESYEFEKRFHASSFCSPIYKGYKISHISIKSLSKDSKYLKKLGAMNLTPTNIDLKNIDQEKYDFLYKYYLESISKNSL